jgi:hypothetical protein
MRDRVALVCRMLRAACLVAGIIALPPAPAAYAWGAVIIFVPLFRPPAPPPVRPQPPTLVWPMPRALPSSPFPQRPPPSARCYAGSTVCPLEQFEVPGQSCSCPVGDERAKGQVLIPPSREIGAAASAQ